ncbi:MAG: DUF4325 domain-containing protein [Chloroflexi bacterium]|nr:DUF4325 domain-containing protein [Chloroflexota bacterium]
MSIRLSTYGRSFATRERAQDILARIDSDDITEIDLSGVRAASPSFLDEFFGGLVEQTSSASLVNVNETLQPLVERVLARRNLERTFRLLAPA